MPTTLNWLRYALLLVAVVSTVYLEKITPYSQYIFFVLAFVLLVRVGDRRVPQRLQPLFLFAEILFAGWLSFSYAGLLYLLFSASLLSLPQRQNGKLHGGTVALLLLVMNASLLSQAHLHILFANLMAATVAALLFHLQLTSQQKGETEFLYDQLRKKHYELEEARQRIIDYAKKIESYAQLEERNRIAREIHDDLGHKLIRLKMMMDASVQIFPRQSEKALSMIMQVRDQLTESMESLRATVQRMKPDETAVNLYSLDRLIAEAGANLGIKLDFRISGIPYPLYPSEEFVLYRNAQEALTNAIRHGQAETVWIELAYHPQQITLSISNNGILPPTTELKRGLGLSGMEERIAVFGGHIEITCDERFTVKTVLPRRTMESGAL
jgi:signal transduction histidine kinase